MSKKQPDPQPPQPFSVERRSHGATAYGVVVCHHGMELSAEWYRGDTPHCPEEICKLLNWAFARGWRAREFAKLERAEFCAVEPEA